MPVLLLVCLPARLSVGRSVCLSACMLNLFMSQCLHRKDYSDFVVLSTLIESHKPFFGLKISAFSRAFSRSALFGFKPSSTHAGSPRSRRGRFEASPAAYEALYYQVPRGLSQEA